MINAEVLSEVKTLGLIYCLALNCILLSRQWKLRRIPKESLVALATIYDEGAKRYGSESWKTYTTKEKQKARLYHAMAHLGHFINGTNQEEDNLAKVAWFCFTMIYFRETGQDQLTPIPDENQLPLNLF